MRFHSKYLKLADKLAQHHSLDYNGLPLVIEWPKGSVRTGVNGKGEKWKREMVGDYGYLDDGSTTKGDDEALDIYVGDDKDSDRVFMVEQLKEDGEFDEFKAILGCPTLLDAKELYLKHYPDEWEDTRLGEIYEVPFESLLEEVEKHQEASEPEETRKESASGLLPNNSSITASKKPSKIGKSAGAMYQNAITIMR